MFLEDWIDLLDLEEKDFKDENLCIFYKKI